MLRIAALALLVTAPTVATAQPGSTTRVGLGIRLGTDLVQFADRNGLSITPAPQFMIPIDVNGSIRVEPEVSYTSASGATNGFTQSSQLMVLGLGVSALVPTEDLTLTLGARARYLRATTEVTRVGNATDSGLAIGPVIGGGYPFSDRFALGAEAGLQYSTSLGDGDDVSLISTTAALTARFFF